MEFFKTTENDNSINIIYLDSRLDTTNAPKVENELNIIIKDLPNKKVVLDLDNLDYISSAGLRVILRLKKAFDDTEIINVKSEVYEIFDMTGFTEMIDIKKAYRKFDVEGCKVIGKGAKGTVYRYNDDTVIKVYNDVNSLKSIERERELARKAFVLGVPTAISFDIVKVGDKYGSVFELLDASSFSILINNNDENFEKYVNIFADMLRLIHSIKVKKTDMPSCKDTYVQKWVSACKDNISLEDYQKLVKLIDECEEKENMLHFDYHTNNIMMQKGEALTIDMDTLCYGNPIFEIGNLCFTYSVQARLNEADALSFLDMKAEVYNKIWPLFIRRYLNSDDENYIKEVELKAELLGYMRFLRHNTHHKDLSIKENMDAQNKCIEGIHNLLKQIDTLNIL